MIRFDGIYQSYKINNNYWGYHRFYDDKTVLSVSSRAQPEEIMRYLTKKNRNYGSQGIYSIKEKNISFSSIGEAGTVNYEGIIENDKIVLKHFSQINGHRDVIEYYFLRL